MVAAAIIERYIPTSGPAAEKEQNEGPSLAAPAARAALAVVPRLSSPLRAGSITIPPGGAPRAGGNAEDAFLANDRVMARVVAGERRFPALLLATWEGGGWRSLAASLPLLEVNAGEEGQRPWWETFRWRETRFRSDKTSAILTLLGTAGTRWRAELTLESRPNTAVLEGRILLTPLRTLRCYGIRLPRLLPIGDEANGAKADGSLLSVTHNEPILPEEARVRAARSGNTLFGLAWPAAPPLPEWKWAPLPMSDTSLLSAPGVQWDAPEAGSVLLPKASIEVSFRLFTFGPSDTLKDALRFMPP
jgi:hypothetical protein